MSIESEADVEGLKKSGRIVAMTLQEMVKHVKPGITTGELNRIGEEYMRRHGARSAPILAYNFPAATCISVNDEAAHGIPGNRVLVQGDLVNIDVSAEVDGYYTDTGASIPVGVVSPTRQRLLKCTRAALTGALASAQAGRYMNSVGEAVQTEAKRCGFRIVRNLTGHGVGRHIHEDPDNVANYYDARDRRKFKEGLVVAIEPFLSTGAEYVTEMGDGWTLKTPDGSVTAQFEHTVVITRGKPIILTAL